MSGHNPIEILCPACGQEAILRRTPRYEGFRRAGENLACSACGHAFASEAEVPFKTKKNSDLFDRSELEGRPKIFKPDEAARLCRHCAHYVVNPFAQRCALRHEEVEATDSCARFTPRPAAAKKETPGGEE
jgi:predicted RNA-binding Zn-ribbon protein involved in translation (DUF1610 family)